MPAVDVDELHHVLVQSKCDMTRAQVEKMFLFLDENGDMQMSQDELQASQFQSGSIAGKKLIQKCKELQAENDQLGKDLSEGRVQKLRADAALQKEYEGELKRALGETREWVEHLTEELDTSQELVLAQRRELNALKAKHAD